VRVPFRLIYSVRAPAERYYTAPLRQLERAGDGLDVAYVYTRTAPENWSRPLGRIGADDITAHGWPPDFEPLCFVCGPTGFVETVASILIGLGHDPGAIKTERFGPTGG
jgi:ferredoxin-NADP reductase